MKRTIFLALLCASLLSYANDIIVTTDNQKLEVKITAVTREAITYKMPDYLDGPDFTLETSGINSIVFENGQVKTYNHTTAASTTPATSTQGATTQKEQVTTPAYKMSYDGHSFFRNGIRMEDDEYLHFIKNTCPEAYNTYKKGVSTYVGGLVCACVGGTLAIAGISVELAQGSPEVALSLLVPAAAAEIAAIPCVIVGIKKVRNSAEVYNMSCGKSQAKLHLGLSADQYGLGLALRF